MKQRAARLLFLVLVIVLVTFLLPVPINPWVGLLFKPQPYETAGVHELSLDEAARLEDARLAIAKTNLANSFKMTGSIEGVFENSISRIIALPDRRILVGGMSGAQLGFARLMPDGKLDQPYVDRVSQALFGVVKDIFPEPDGSIILLGRFELRPKEGQPRVPATGLVKIRNDGSIDVAFASRLSPVLKTPDRWVQGRGPIAHQAPDGSIFVVGAFEVAKPRTFELIKISPDGQSDPGVGLLPGFSVEERQVQEFSLGRAPDGSPELFLQGLFVKDDTTGLIQQKTRFVFVAADSKGAFKAGFPQPPASGAKLIGVTDQGRAVFSVTRSQEETYRYRGVVVASGSSLQLLLLETLPGEALPARTSFNLKSGCDSRKAPNAGFELFRAVPGTEAFYLGGVIPGAESAPLTPAPMLLGDVVAERRLDLAEAPNLERLKEALRHDPVSFERIKKGFAEIDGLFVQLKPSPVPSVVPRVAPSPEVSGDVLSGEGEAEYVPSLEELVQARIQPLRIEGPCELARLVRVNEKGAIDPTFKPLLAADLKSGQYEGLLRDFAIESKPGGVVIGGAFTLVRGQARRNIARLKLDGEL